MPKRTRRNFLGLNLRLIYFMVWFFGLNGSSYVSSISALDLECGVETIESLFIRKDKDCDLCEILRNKLPSVAHCQTNVCSRSSPTYNSHHHTSSLLNNLTLGGGGSSSSSVNRGDEGDEEEDSSDEDKLHPKGEQNSRRRWGRRRRLRLRSIQWDKTIPNSSNNNKEPLYHVLIRKRSTSKLEEPEYLYLTFNTYPSTILPKICEERRHPVQSPFGHLCPPNTKCLEDDSQEGYNCECKDECSKTWLLRKILEWIQIVCIVVCVILCLVVYWLRKTKVMSIAMWPIIESILFGSILLYVSVILKIEIPNDPSDPEEDEDDTTDPHDPSAAIPIPTLCLMEPWTREIGFTLLYGGLTLKIYRSLVEFRTRKAHRWVVREKDILRYLCTMTCVVLFYMTSWTVTTNGVTGDVVGDTNNYNHIYCPVTWWHRVTELGEVLFLCVGLNMAWHLRRAPVSPFKNHYTAALLIETTTNVLGIIIRESGFIYMAPNEEEVFLMVLYFIRCQLTTTVILFIVVVPKLYYIREEKRKRQLRRGDTTSSGLAGAGRKALEAAINNGELDFADINIADMDPQDIRLELKRVYTQLELLRNKTMRKDNPHISKRRGGRKPTHRRFSLQALRRQQQQQSHYQQQSHHTQRSFRGYAHDDIEDSVCSIEGPSTYSEAGR